MAQREGPISVIQRYEQQVLDEYRLMAEHIDNITKSCDEVSSGSPLVLNNMRTLEPKIALILTALKASVWHLRNKQTAAAEAQDY